MNFLSFIKLCGIFVFLAMLLGNVLTHPVSKNRTWILAGVYPVAKRSRNDKKRNMAGMRKSQKCLRFSRRMGKIKYTYYAEDKI